MRRHWKPSALASVRCCSCALPMLMLIPWNSSHAQNIVPALCGVWASMCVYASVCVANEGKHPFNIVKAYGIRRCNPTKCTTAWLCSVVLVPFVPTLMILILNFFFFCVFLFRRFVDIFFIFSGLRLSCWWWWCSYTLSPVCLVVICSWLFSVFLLLYIQMAASTFCGWRHACRQRPKQQNNRNTDTYSYSYAMSRNGILWRWRLYRLWFGLWHAKQNNNRKLG